MSCRRCFSSRLILLSKKCSRDNDIYRCRDCGFIFSPSRDSISQRRGG